MTLTCRLKSGTEKVVRVPFEPPLSGYDDVKPRLLAMRAEAQEKLGMVCFFCLLKSASGAHRCLCVVTTVVDTHSTDHVVSFASDRSDTICWSLAVVLLHIRPERHLFASFHASGGDSIGNWG
jgi:hypothetical protein